MKLQYYTHTHMRRQPAVQKDGQWICCGRVWLHSDGFPQTRSQVATLDTKTDTALVDVLIMICLGRRVCSGCGTTHTHIHMYKNNEDSYIERIRTLIY